MDRPAGGWEARVQCYSCPRLLPSVPVGGTRADVEEYVEHLFRNFTREGRQVFGPCPDCKPQHVRLIMQLVRPRFLDGAGLVSNRRLVLHGPGEAWHSTTRQFVPANLDRHGEAFMRKYQFMWDYEMDAGRVPASPEAMHARWAESPIGFLEPEDCASLSRGGRLAIASLVGTCFLEVFVEGRLEIVLLLDFLGAWGFVAKSWWGLPEASSPAHRRRIDAVAFTLMEVAALVGAPHVYLGWLTDGVERMGWKRRYFKYADILEGGRWQQPPRPRATSPGATSSRRRGLGSRRDGPASRAGAPAHPRGSEPRGLRRGVAPAADVERAGGESPPRGRGWAHPEAPNR